MDTPKEEEGCGGSGGGGYPAAPQHQESSTVFSHFSNLYPLNSVEPCLQAGDPGPVEAAPTVGDGEPLRSSTWAEQAPEEHHFVPHNVVQRFNVSPDVYPYWHPQTSLFHNQEAQDAIRRHLNFDVEVPCHGYIPGSHNPYASHDHAGYSWGVPPPSLPNLGQTLLSNGGLQESSSWQQIIDASNMPFQYPCDQAKLIQMPEDWKSSFVFSSPTGEVSDLVVYGQNGDGATKAQKRSSHGNGSKSQDQERAAELNSVTPKRGSKRKAEAIENGGCKRCNCKRSKCLKLYCECFAAGLYCIDSCTCEDCYNSLDFEDTVLETRRQLESRNPLAFAPRIVPNGNNSPPDKAEGGGSEVSTSSVRASTSSVRHIRGCNCRKSHCVKRYCDCFQAEVGCSDECNCENCWNPYRPKSAERRIERRDTTPHGTPDSMPGMPNSIGTGTGDQSASTCEGTVNMPYSTPSPRRIERRETTPHGTPDSMPGMPDSIGTGTGGQSASLSEGTVNMPNSTPSPSPSACSKHSNSGDCSSSTQAERSQGTVPPRLPRQPFGTPPSDRDKAPPRLVGVSITHHAVKGVSISGTGTSSLSNPANASLPNQGQVSTPQQYRRPSIISPSSRRARKPVSQTRPSLDGKSKDGSSEA